MEITGGDLRDSRSENLCGNVSLGNGSVPQLSVGIHSGSMERPVRFENEGVATTGGNLGDSGSENLCGCVSGGGGSVP